MKLAWTIAGSDSSACAGVQADLKTFQSLGVHGCSVITAVTAQNSQELTDVNYLSTESIAAQIYILCKDQLPRAIKIGMLGHAALQNFLSSYKGFVVLDPVMISTSGKQLFVADLATYLTDINKILPFVDILTPNIPEAEKMIGRSLPSYQAIETAAQQILLLGVKSVLIKGGHFNHSQFSQDYWTNGQSAFWLISQKNQQQNFRGTGCTLSAAITACLALGYDIKDALVIAKMYVNQAIRLASAGHLLHANWPEEEIDLPYLMNTPMESTPGDYFASKFVDCGTRPLGLYPIVDDINWLAKLLPLGVKTIQLRIKNQQGQALEQTIQRAVALAQQYAARLFINDYWQLAIRYQAYGVHLGQEDLAHANIEEIRQAGICLGISTHGYYEVARAHSLQPSYIACGPIFPTTSKIMTTLPQGITQLRRWQRTLHYPLVAIGGINLENIAEVIASNVSGIAMISAITHAQDPIAMTRKLLNLCY